MEGVQKPELESPTEKELETCKYPIIVRAASCSMCAEVTAHVTSDEGHPTSGKKQQRGSLGVKGERGPCPWLPLCYAHSPNKRSWTTYWACTLLADTDKRPRPSFKSSFSKEAPGLISRLITGWSDLAMTEKSLRGQMGRVSRHCQEGLTGAALLMASGALCT